VNIQKKTSLRTTGDNMKKILHPFSRHVPGVLAAAAVAAALAVAACGGSDGGSPPGPGQVPAPPPVAAGPVPELYVLSNRADLVSGGDALVEVVPPAGVDPATLRLTLNGDDVSSSFARRADGRYYGLVTGLADGDNALRAAMPQDGAAAQLVIKNHPIGGPVFSGAQLGPWTCSTTSNPSLGAAVDDKCNAPTQYRYMYRRTTGQFAAFDPAAAAPIDLATTVTDAGLTVPYIVRIERGTLNRGIHEIAVLFDPARGWTPWDRQPQWNGKVLVKYGAGTGQRYSQGTPESVMENEALSAGFAVISSSMMINSQHANFVTAAETTMMLLERIREAYGPIRYTIGQGDSGGALLQHLIADNYPGLLSGLRPTNDWEDSISGAYREFADSGVLTTAFNNSTLTYSVEERAAIGGWGAANINVFNIENGRIGDYMQPNDGTSCAGADSYHATNNPGGVRCTFQDFISSIIGKRPDGKANAVYDNVGVQYGLAGLRAGTLSPEKFVDINVRAGGYDIDGVWQPQRSAITPEVAALLHRTGQVTYGRQLGNVPELAIRGTNNNDYHYPFRTYVQRARLIAANGHADNHVFWTSKPSAASTFKAMDRWLAAIEADTGREAASVKVVRNKPADLVTACWIGGVMQPDQAACDVQYPYFREPRTIAGEASTIYTMKCQLKPLVRADYFTVAFTDAQWAALQGAFPEGVCDYSRPAVGFQENVPWLDYSAGPGGQPLPAVPASTKAP
jgi:hypothetical protein